MEVRAPVRDIVNDAKVDSRQVRVDGSTKLTNTTQLLPSDLTHLDDLLKHAVSIGHFRKALPKAVFFFWDTSTPVSDESPAVLRIYQRPSDMNRVVKDPQKKPLSW